MRNYELTLVFSGDLKAEQLAKALEGVISFIQDKGGILLNQEMRGKRALLAPIKSHKEGNLAALKFTIDPSNIEELEKHLKGNQNILRFLCLVSVSRKMKAKTPHLAVPAESLPMMPKEQAFDSLGTESSGRTSEAQARRAEGESQKIDLGDIDKKLEEIFKQL